MCTLGEVEHVLRPFFFFLKSWPIVCRFLIYFFFLHQLDRRTNQIHLDYEVIKRRTQIYKSPPNPIGNV